MTHENLPPILEYPHSLLSQSCQPVSSRGVELDRLIRQLIEARRAGGGAGLAAPQIGIQQRVAVIDGPAVELGRNEIVLVNPEITASGGRQRGEEGCLSFPGAWARISRPAEVTVRGWDPSGGELSFTATGLAARAVCHEVDHLDGVLLPDRMGPIRRWVFLLRYSLRRWLRHRGKSDTTRF